jgi:hypothetical protein
MAGVNALVGIALVTFNEDTLHATALFTRSISSILKHQLTLGLSEAEMFF